MVHIQTSPNFAVFPDSLQFPSRLDISGFPGRALPDLIMFSDSLHHSLPFPIAFIFRLGHFGTCPPSSRPTSYPIVSGCYCLPSSDISGFFPSSSRFASCSTSSGYFAFTFGSFRMCSVFPNRFVFHNCRMLPSSDIVGCSRLLHDSFRVPSFPNASAFHVRTFLYYFVFFPIRFVFHHFRICQSSSRFGRPQRV